MKQTKQKVALRLLSLTKPYLRYLVLAFLSAVVSSVFSLLIPVLIGRGIDSIIGRNQVDFKAIAFVLLLIGVCILVSGLFGFAMSYCTNTISFRTVRDLRVHAFEKLNRVPLSYIDKTAHGDIVSRLINDIDQISDGLIQGVSQFFTAVVTIVTTLLFMLSINWMIALVVVVLTPLSFFVANFITKRTRAMFRKTSEIQGDLSGYIQEMMNGQKVVRSFGYEEQATEKFKTINAQLKNYGIKSQFYSSLANPCTRFVNGIVYACVGVFGALGVVNGLLTVGQLSSFLTYANQYTKPFNEVTGVIAQLQSAFASAGRVFELLDQQEIKEDTDKTQQDVNLESSVSFENVDFSYVPAVPLIKDLTLFAKPGYKVAIVGPTGCGKTTLINLLMRFYEIDKGCIRVGGVDSRDMTRKALRSHFGMVLQDTWTFQGTVRENIRYGRQDATDAQVEEAAKQANAHSFIMQLPQGYDTQVSEDAGNISQGQRQLLCIARVMLVNPQMLILDEATSNIDTRTEVFVTRAFDKMMQNKTSFIVAHRLSTIQKADVILVMDSGRIVEQGTHEQLLRQNGFYSRLYNSQYEAG